MNYLSLILALGVGAIFTIALGALLFRNVGKSSPKNPHNIGKLEIFPIAHLQESIRLAEIRLDDVNLAKSELEKKAIWLAIFCAGGIAFISKELGSVTVEGVVLRLLTIFSLLISVFLIVSSLKLRNYGVKGLPPYIAVGEWLDNKYNCNENMRALLHYALIEYDERIATGEQSNKVKVHDLKWAMLWTAISAGFLISATLFPLFMEIKIPIRAWVWFPATEFKIR